MELNNGGDCFIKIMCDDICVPQLQQISDEIERSKSVPTPDEIEPSKSVPNSSLKQDKTRRLGNFTPEEDIALVNAWLNTSINSCIGTNQKAKTFWSNINKNYREYPPTFDVCTDRSLVNRGDIQKVVNKFMGVVANVEDKPESGSVEQDKIGKTKKLYREMHGSSFKLDHCWNLLRLHPKWLETNGVVGRKKRPLTTVLDDSVHSNSSVDLERPPEKKAMKQNKKKDKGMEEIFDYADWMSKKIMMHDQKLKLEENKLMVIKEAEDRRAKLEQDKE